MQSLFFEILNTDAGIKTQPLIFLKFNRRNVGTVGYVWSFLIFSFLRSYFSCDFPTFPTFLRSYALISIFNSECFESDA